MRIYLKYPKGGENMRKGPVPRKIGRVEVERLESSKLKSLKRELEWNLSEGG